MFYVTVDLAPVC